MHNSRVQMESDTLTKSNFHNSFFISRFCSEMESREDIEKTHKFKLRPLPYYSLIVSTFSMNIIFIITHKTASKVSSLHLL